MANVKKEIIDNVLLTMSRNIDRTALDILQYTLENQLASVNVERISTLPVEVNETIDEQNKYYMELMMIKKKNLSDGSRREYMRSIKNLAALIDKPFTEMDEIDIDKYLHWFERRSDGTKKQATTCNNERRHLSAFFGWMRKEGFITENPVESTEPYKEVQKPIDYFRPRQVEELRSGCKNARDRALIEVLRSTGARVGEIVSINKTDIDWSTGDVTILSEKSNKYRTLYLDESSRYYLKKYLDTRKGEDPALFTSLEKPYGRLSKNAIEISMTKIGKRAGIEGRVYPHKMRKTLGMNLRNAGVDVGSIQEILGHANPDTTTRYYAQSTPETLREIRRKYA